MNFSFGKRNEDLLKLSCDRKLSFYLPHFSGETNAKKEFSIACSLMGKLSADYARLYHFFLQVQLIWHNWATRRAILSPISLVRNYRKILCRLLGSLLTGCLICHTFRSRSHTISTAWFYFQLGLPQQAGNLGFFLFAKQKIYLQKQHNSSDCTVFLKKKIFKNGFICVLIKHC